MTKYVNICNLVLFIDSKTTKAYKGTKFKHTYLWYHDALSTMTDNDCMKWMEDEGILKRWIQPILDLNDVVIIVDENGNEKLSKKYAGRPVGDCSECCLWTIHFFGTYSACTTFT